MTDDAIIRGTYSDLKFIRTRSVAQVLIELPIEQADAFVKAFGTPQPGKEIHVAIARLNETAAQTRPSAPLEAPQKSRTRRAAFLCHDVRFRAFLNETYQMNVSNAEEAAQAVRDFCGVSSRRYLDYNTEASSRWDSLYERWKAFKIMEGVR
ncbi:hypothetical protein [Rhodoligotrophos ferricapiens]|uniref:hypothetical protein n=1 Tax=Rhodoligotrophos ferricapiens TaxID=3069264 RepID=UPI00315C79B8